MSGTEVPGREWLQRRGVLLLLLASGWAAGLVGAEAWGQGLTTGFQRDVNRYRWTADLAVDRTVGAWDVTVANRFLSDAFLLFDDRLSFRDENRLVWQARRPLGGPWALRLRGRADWYSLSRVAGQDTYVGLRYAPEGDWWVEPAAGVAWDQRPGAATGTGLAPLRTDVGPALGLRAAWRAPGDALYAAALRGSGSWRAITPRRAREVRLEGEAERVFEGTRLGAEVRAASVRRDAYQAVSFLNRDTPTDRRSETVEATTSDTLVASVLLDAPFYRGLRLTSRLDVGLNNRDIRTLRAPDETLFFDSDFRRRTVDLEVTLAYERPTVRASLTARGGAEVERRRLANREALPPTQAAQKSDLLRQADFDRGDVMLMGRVLAPLGRLTLSADAQASILRHDTPEVNPDDRDEVFYSGQAGARLRLSRYVAADVQLFGTYYHTVYLKAERSAENNVQRSLRLRPAVTWTPSRRTDVQVSTEVRATYTVDDFVLPGRRPTDQSAREMRYAAELEHDFGGGRRLRATGSLSELHLGRFFADSFAEIPFDTLRTQSGWVRLQAGERVVAEVGLRFFIRRDYSRTTQVRYERVDETGAPVLGDDGTPVTTVITRPGVEVIAQVGPTCAITWTMRRGSSLRLDGWATRQRVRQRLYGDLPEGAAERIRAAARAGSRTLIPNVALTATWRF